MREEKEAMYTPIKIAHNTKFTIDEVKQKWPKAVKQPANFV